MHGGRSPQNEQKYNSEEINFTNNHNSYNTHGNYITKSKAKFGTPSRSNNRYDEVSLNDIKMDFSETSSRREVPSYPSKSNMTKSKAKINNISKMYG